MSAPPQRKAQADNTRYTPCLNQCSTRDYSY